METKKNFVKQQQPITTLPPKKNKNWDIYTNLHFIILFAKACKKRRRNARAFDQFCPHMPGPLSTFKKNQIEKISLQT